MATIRQIQTALENAKAAGDQAAVVRLSQILEKAIAAGTPEGGMPTEEVVSRAFANAPGSLYNYGSDMVNAFTHPIDTISTLGDLGAGALREGARAVLPTPVFNVLDSVGSKQAAERATATATAVGRHYADRYGSTEGFKRAIAEDPVGVASDLSLPFTGGGGLVAKLGGPIGAIGRGARFAGEIMDPVSAAGKVARGGGRAISAAAGYTSGLGDTVLGDIFNARRRGGVEADAANRGMREAPRGDALVQEAMDKMGVLGDQARQRYQQAVATTKANRARINWNNIFRTIHDTIRSNMTTRGGRFYGGPTGRRMVQEILDTVHQYVSDPALHNLEGLDALKQELSQLQYPIGPNPVRGAENANRIVTNIIDGVRNEITRLDPSYAPAMDDYSRWKDLQSELRNTLSLNDKAATDTTLRKLQSTMRNNVQTNWGARNSLLDEIDAVGNGRNLTPGTLRAELAGQAANSWMPRGIGRAGSAFAIPAAATWLTHNLGYAASAIPFMAMASPRLVGEAAGLLGDAARGIDTFARNNPRTVATVRAATSNPARQAARQVGVMDRQKEGVIQDANGNWYDAKGRLIQQ